MIAIDSGSLCHPFAGINRDVQNQSHSSGRNTVRPISGARWPNLAVSTAHVGLVFIENKGTPGPRHTCCWSSCDIWPEYPVDTTSCRWPARSINSATPDVKCWSSPRLLRHYFGNTSRNTLNRSRGRRPGTDDLPDVRPDANIVGDVLQTERAVGDICG